MEWSKIKTILICIFTAINIFLFVMFFKGIYTDTTLGEEVLKSTADILLQNNVKIEQSEIPKIHSNVKICTVENKYKSVDLMLAEAKKVSAGNGINYLKEENTEIKGDSFTCTVNSAESVSKPVNYAKKMMKKTGLLDDVDYYTREEGGYLYFYLKFSDKIFYDSYLRVKADEKGIQEIYGHNWLGDSVIEGGVTESISPAEVLINFAVNGKFESAVTVSSVESGYYIGERNETVRVTAFPVWEIRLDNGARYYYDMRNGDLLNNGI